MIVALLDDGIDLYRCPGFSITHDLIVEESGAIRPRRAGEAVLTDHGTTCAQIIHTYAPEAEFCSLGIFRKPKLTTGLPQLLAALEWCLEKRIPLIHMSVGSTQLCDDEPIRKVIAKMLYRGQIIVAAHSNKLFRYTMPACYSGVLGVSADAGLMGNQFYVKGPSPDDVQIFASAKHDLSQYPGNLSTVTAPVSNSYAAPTITAEVHNILSRSDQRPYSSYSLIQQLAGCTIALGNMRPDFLEDAIVYDPMRTFRNAYAGFQVLNIFTDKAPFFMALEHNRYSPVLLVPPMHLNSQFVESLFLRSKQRVGIAYAGMAPPVFPQTSPCLFWSEDTHCFLATQLYERPLPPQIPFMQIEPQGEIALDLLYQLKDLFSSDGYGCISISDFPRAYLYGVDFAADYCPADYLAAHLCHTRHPDLVLYSLCNSKSVLPCDMQVVFEDCRTANIQENLAILPMEPSREDVEVLYASLFDE